MFDLRLNGFFEKDVSYFTFYDAYAFGYLFNHHFSQEMNFETFHLSSPTKSVLQIVVTSLFSKKAIAAIEAYASSEDIYYCEFAPNNLFFKERTELLEKLINHNDQELIRAFLRGNFDVSGGISFNSSGLDGQPAAHLIVDMHSKELIGEVIKNVTDIKFDIMGDYIVWVGFSALDYIQWVYQDKMIIPSHKQNEITNLQNYVTIIKGVPEPLSFTYSKLKSEAIEPFKDRPSDSGYMITAIEEINSNGIITQYGTGINVATPYGWYFDVLPVKNLFTTGYVFANGVGVINQNDNGEITIPLLKIYDDAEPLKLPFVIAQIIPRPIVHLNFVEEAKVA
jgi:dUTPase